MPLEGLSFLNKSDDHGLWMQPETLGWLPKTFVLCYIKNFLAMIKKDFPEKERGYYRRFQCYLFPQNIKVKATIKAQIQVWE